MRGVVTIASNTVERKVWCRPTSTFSVAVISPNSCTFWKVRAMPPSAIWDGVRPVIGWPANTTPPEVGL